MIGRQLAESLERLGTDHVDVYFMHRDNPDVPVAEFVDALDAEVRAGRIRGPFGGSNWTRERFDEAVAYAGANGKAAPTALSNNFSLAEMVEPIWEGCVAASDDGLEGLARRARGDELRLVEPGAGLLLARGHRRTARRSPGSGTRRPTSRGATGRGRSRRGSGGRRSTSRSPTSWRSRSRWCR